MRTSAQSALSFFVVPHYDVVRPDPGEEWVQQLARKYGKTPDEVADFAEETANALFIQTGEHVVWSRLIGAIHDGYELLARAKREREYDLAKKNAMKKTKARGKNGRKR